MELNRKPGITSNGAMLGFFFGAPGMGNNYKVKDQNALGSRKR